MRRGSQQLHHALEQAPISMRVTLVHSERRHRDIRAQRKQRDQVGLQDQVDVLVEAWRQRGVVVAAGSVRRLAVLIHTASRTMTHSISSMLSVYARLFAGISAFVSRFCSIEAGPTLLDHLHHVLRLSTEPSRTPYIHMRALLLAVMSTPPASLSVSALIDLLDRVPREADTHLFLALELCPQPSAHVLVASPTLGSNSQRASMRDALANSATVWSASSRKASGLGLGPGRTTCGRRPSLREQL